MKLIPVSIVICFLFFDVAAAESMLFGEANYMIHRDHDSAGTRFVTIDDHKLYSQWNISDIDSHIGLTGHENITYGLKAFYYFEFGLPLNSGGPLRDKDQYIGISSDYGSLILGRKNTPLKSSLGDFDQFDDIPVADIKDLVPGEDRTDNLLMYISPNLDNWYFSGAVIAGEDKGNNLDGLADYLSIAFVHNGENIYGSLSYNRYTHMYDMLSHRKNPDTELYRGVLIWKQPEWQLGFMASYFNFNSDLNDIDSSKAFGVSGNVKFGQSGMIKSQYIISDDLTINDSSNTLNGLYIDPSFHVPDVTAPQDKIKRFSIGYDHALSKNTMLYVGTSLTKGHSPNIAYKNKISSTVFAGMSHQF